MATQNIIGLYGNDRVRDSRVMKGTLPITTDTVSGDVYQVGAIPAGAIVTNVYTIVKTAVNGTTPTVDVGVTGSGALYQNDLDVSSTGMTASATADAYYANGTIVTVTPALTSATAGEVCVMVEYITDIFSGTYATEQ